MGAWIVGGLALVLGLAIGSARAKSKSQASLVPEPTPGPDAPPPPQCDVNSLAMWAQGRGLKGAIVANRAALSLIGAPSDRFDVVITQNDCAVHSWDGTAWVFDGEKTTDMQGSVGANTQGEAP